jgi:hypothetical protein
LAVYLYGQIRGFLSHRRYKYQPTLSHYEDNMHDVVDRVR